MEPPAQPTDEKSAAAERLKTPIRRQLIESEADSNPLTQFRLWFDEALSFGMKEPTAMVLATATPQGLPSARVVLLKGQDELGFTFFTNYLSRKGRELNVNPAAALTFYWSEMERQVRVEGRVQMVTPEESDEYFRSRPRESQLGAWTSEQSEVIGDRSMLEERLVQLVSRFGDGPIPRPPHWGGFRLVPDVLEFWQGRTGRLHDRLRYARMATGEWQRQRLAP